MFVPSNTPAPFKSKSTHQSRFTSACTRRKKMNFFFHMKSRLKLTMIVGLCHTAACLGLGIPVCFMKDVTRSAKALNRRLRVPPFPPLALALALASPSPSPSPRPRPRPRPPFYFTFTFTFSFFCFVLHECDATAHVPAQVPCDKDGRVWPSHDQARACGSRQSVGQVPTHALYQVHCRCSQGMRVLCTF